MIQNCFHKMWRKHSEWFDFKILWIICYWRTFRSHNGPIIVKVSTFIIFNEVLGVTLEIILSRCIFSLCCVTLRSARSRGMLLFTWIVKGIWVMNCPDIPQAIWVIQSWRGFLFVCQLLRYNIQWQWQGQGQWTQAVTMTRHWNGNKQWRWQEQWSSDNDTSSEDSRTLITAATAVWQDDGDTISGKTSKPLWSSVLANLVFDKTRSSREQTGQHRNHLTNNLASRHNLQCSIFKTWRVLLTEAFICFTPHHHLLIPQSGIDAWGLSWSLSRFNASSCMFWQNDMSYLWHMTIHNGMSGGNDTSGSNNKNSNRYKQSQRHKSVATNMNSSNVTSSSNDTNSWKIIRNNNIIRLESELWRWCDMATSQRLGIATKALEQGHDGGASEFRAHLWHMLSSSFFLI